MPVATKILIYSVLGCLAATVLLLFGDLQIDPDVRRLLTVLLLVIGCAAILVWVISAGVRSALAHRENQNAQKIGTTEPPAFPVIAKPRFFAIEGVKKETAEDIALQVAAASPENAKAKAELQGIVVTAVREITG